MNKVTLVHDDCLVWLRAQPDALIHCCVTDAPYGIKFMGKAWDYDVPSVEIWRELLRVLKPGGTLLCFAGSRTQHRMAVNIEDAGFKLCDTLLWLYGQGFPKGRDLGDGWKSHALKPAYEPIIMAMRPNEGSYADNALVHGVAGLHIDACRVPSPGENITTHARVVDGSELMPQLRFHPQETHQRPGQQLGRYPANLLHDGSDEVVEGFPNVKAGKAIRHRSGGKNCHSDTKKPAMPDMGYGDDGSAARFFYVAKPSKKEKQLGKHVTQKPLALMQWLVRLVCPLGGIVLDPFMGSGTTGVACREEGFEFIGIERELESYETAKRRCDV